MWSMGFIAAANFISRDARYRYDSRGHPTNVSLPDNSSRYKTAMNRPAREAPTSRGRNALLQFVLTRLWFAVLALGCPSKGIGQRAAA